MTRRFGDRATFAVQIGEVVPPSLRVVDLWAAGKWLTADDNVDYVPSLRHCLRTTAGRVGQRKMPPHPFPERSAREVFLRLEADRTHFREQYWFMQWSEILDRLPRYAFLDQDDVVVVFSFWRAAHQSPVDQAEVFAARMRSDELAATMDGAADLLEAEQAD